MRAGGFAAFALNGQRHDRPMLFMPISTETVLPYSQQARTYAADTVVPSIRLEFSRGNWNSSHYVLVPFTLAMRSRGEHAVLSAAVLTAVGDCPTNHFGVRNGWQELRDLTPTRVPLPLLRNLAARARPTGR
jgi:hypothetical protein